MTPEASSRDHDATRETRFFEATDDLIRAVLGVVQSHYGPDEGRDADVVALHQRLADAAGAYLDAPAIYPWRPSPEEAP